jgi:predicted acyl esterase
MKRIVPTFVWIMMECVCASAEAGAGANITERNILIPTGDGATICARVVRPASALRLPAALEFTIYVDPKSDLERLEYAADRGYVGVIAYTRGKACSPQDIIPYEYDGRDANSVIDWIAKQPWSDGQVGMMGGSYDGFTQWAAAKLSNEHLKTIVPVVPNNPGNGLPLQNNIFLLANYAWIYYATDNKTLDETLYHDPKWGALPRQWYLSGRPYADIDTIAGVPNPWLHQWLRHPSYDAYWQSMSPYREDYARIRIPVLTIAGYYGDSTAIGYFNDLQRYNPQARNYLIAGPWDHFGSQGRIKPDVLRGYPVDPAAQMDTWKLTFDWFDFVMRGKARPALVQNRVNVEVMGENRWRHVPSLDDLGKPERFYLTATRTNQSSYLLSMTPSKMKDGSGPAVHQEVDLADRNTMTNDSYPYLVLGKKLDFSDGYTFVTQPFPRAEEVSGMDAVVHLRVNKRDLDVGLALYEMLPDGQLLQLTYYTERASYAADMSTRHLLEPGREATIPFEQGYLFSRLVGKGSRLLLTVNVNKNAFAEINYGTGKDVSTESIADAGSPLQVDWLTTSYIRLRLHDPEASPH